METEIESKQREHQERIRRYHGAPVPQISREPLEILRKGEEGLKGRCLDVPFPPEDLLQQMASTLRALRTPAAALASRQVGLAQNMFVYRLFGWKGMKDDLPTVGWSDDIYALINPVIVERAPVNSDYDEGCLSNPGVRYKTQRPMSVLVQGMTYDGRDTEFLAEGPNAQMVQHEVDHLRGTCIWDNPDWAKTVARAGRRR